MTSSSTTSARQPIAKTLVLLFISATVLILATWFAKGETRTWLSVITLGVVEGITEFLPISSTAHLILVADLLNFQGSIGGTFEIFIQLGAILAVVGYYARDLLTQARAVATSAPTRRFWLAILVAFLPAAVIGLLARSWVKQVLFASPTLIAWALIIGGVVLIGMERLTLRATTHNVEQTRLDQALAIGVAQVSALIPGVSRSASSIVGGMFAGLDRATATTFSFYLAIPTLGAATIVDLLGSLDRITPGDVPRLVVGTLVAMITAWMSIGWLLRYVARHSWISFGVYRIVIGITILTLVYMHIL